MLLRRISRVHLLIMGLLGLGWPSLVGVLFLLRLVPLPKNGLFVPVYLFFGSFAAIAAAHLYLRRWRCRLRRALKESEHQLCLWCAHPLDESNRTPDQEDASGKTIVVCPECGKSQILEDVRSAWFGYSA